MNERQLREQRANVWSQMQDIESGASGRALNPEEIQRWNALEGELNTLTEQINVAVRSAAHHGEFDETRERPVDSSTITTRTDDAEDSIENRYTEAFDSFLRGGFGSLEPEQRRLIQQRAMDPREVRALGVGTTTAGGYFVPAGFRQRIVERLKAWGAVRNNAEVITTDTGNTLPWATNDDTANVGAILAENTQVTEQDVVLGQAQLGAYTYTSKLVRVSLQLLQDSAFDVESFLARKFAERLGRATNAHFTTGTGTAQPQGVVTGASSGKVGPIGQTLTVTYNDLVDLIYAVDPAYLTNRSPNLGFMTASASIGAIRKLRDDSGGAGLGRPIWEPSVQLGQPDSLLGYPIIANADMPAMAANAKSVLFGDYQAGYIVREVLGIQSLRLEERYADFLQVGFLAFLRTDGLVQDSNAIKYYQNSAT